MDVVSAPFNAAILGAMFGVPDSDFIQLRHWLDDFFLRETPKEGEEPKSKVAMRHLSDYIYKLVDSHTKDPKDDVLSAMLMAEDEGKKLEHEQIVVTTMTFLVAGFESVNNLFTNLTYALALHPDVYNEVTQNMELIEPLVEEAMRWDSAAQGFVRTPTHDVELHGKVIPENSQVLLHIGSANRDERIFDSPDTFDIHREDNNHLGFGLGIHFCIGNSLGRLMTQILFEDMLKASNQWEIDIDNAVRVTTPNFRGFSTLPLVLKN